MMSQPNLSIIFLSEGGYHVVFEGEPFQLESVDKALDKNTAVGQLINTLLSEANKEVDYSAVRGE